MNEAEGEPVSISAFALRAGEEIGVSRWFLVDQGRIDRFAVAVEDHQFIHVDPERAHVETPFGGTIAHGFLCLSLLSAMAYDVLPRFREPLISVNYGLDRLRFLAPVSAGERICGRFVLAEALERKPGGFRLRHEVTVEREGATRPALVADWITMLMVRE